MSSCRTCSALLLGAAVALSACQRQPETDASCAVRFAIPAPDGAEFAAGQPPALSPDGSHLAAVAMDSTGHSRLWIRSLIRPSGESVADTEGASFPFWSPDGRQLGFFADGRLHRIDRDGSGRRALADAPGGHGGSWGTDGTIVFSGGAGPSIFAIPSGGGAPRQVTNIGTRARGRDFWPTFMPDGTHFVYLSIDDNEEGRVLLGSLRSADRDGVLGACSPVSYLTPGAVLCGWRGALLAWPFDPNVFQTYGKASVIAHPIARGPAGLASFSASADGSTVVYADDGSAIVWVDADGGEVPAMPEAGTRPRVSPSGDRILVSLADSHLYAVYDATHDRWLGGESEGSSRASWAQGGTEVILTFRGTSRTRVVAQRVDRSGERTLFDEPGAFRDAVMPSGRGDLLVLVESQPPSQQLLRVVSLAGKRSLTPRTVWQRPLAASARAAISPDGRWLAFSTAESGTDEVYVTALDLAAVPTRLARPGTHPVWSGDGGQLFYQTDRGIVAVSAAGATTTWAARERTVISASVLRDRQYGGDDFDVSPDGRRVLLGRTARPGGPVVLKGLRSCSGGIATLFPR